MTMLVKESLGGKCMTTMIAALSSRTEHIREMIHMCKFATDVMTLKNNAKANILVDPQIFISLLRAEIVRLKHDLAFAHGEEDETELTPEETERLVASLRNFLSGREPLPPMSPSRVSFCFDWIRANGGSEETAKVTETDSSMGDQERRKAMTKLAKKLQSREVEIGALVNMLNQCKNRAIASTQTSLAVGSESEHVEALKVEKKEAFKKFVRSHPKFAAVKANNATTCAKTQQAKELKVHIARQKSGFQQRASEGADGAELADIVAELTREANRYMRMCADMRALKKEVETLQAMLEVATWQVKKDFATF
jgi:hypothetical protein